MVNLPGSGEKPKHTVTQMVLIKLSGSQNKCEDMNAAKELVGRRGVERGGREMNKWGGVIRIHY